MSNNYIVTRDVPHKNGLINHGKHYQTEKRRWHEVTKFEVLVSITDVKKFSELVFDILKDKKSAKEIEILLNEDYPEEGLQTLKSIAQGGYPLSLEGLQ